MHIFDQQGTRAYVETMMDVKTGSAIETDMPSEQMNTESFWKFLLHVLRPQNKKSAAEKSTR